MAANAYPGNSNNAANYFVDVIFVPDSGEEPVDLGDASALTTIAPAGALRGVRSLAGAGAVAVAPSGTLLKVARLAGHSTVSVSPRGSLGGAIPGRLTARELGSTLAGRELGNLISREV